MTKIVNCQLAPVSERDVIARINRKIQADDLQLKIARSRQMQIDIGGRYCVLQTRINGICHWSKRLDLEAYAREVGALAPYEMVHFEEAAQAKSRSRDRKADLTARFLPDPSD
jgi:hypothetical protein